MSVIFEVDYSCCCDKCHSNILNGDEIYCHDCSDFGTPVSEWIHRNAILLSVEEERIARMIAECIENNCSVQFARKIVA